MVQVPKHPSSIDLYVNECEVKFTFTWEKIQNQCTLILFITLDFEFK
jgi:hypothetical protein